MSTGIDLVLEEFLYTCETRKLSPKTINGYRKLITFLINDLKANGITEIEEVKPSMIKRLIMEKQKAGRKPQYLNDILKALRVFFRYAHEEGYAPSIVTERIHNLQQPKVKIYAFNDAEVKAMLNYFSHRNFLDIRNRAILALFFDTGARMTEMAEMTESQIKRDYIIIYGKGEKERIVPKSPFLGKQLIRYLGVRKSYFGDKKIAPYLFLSKTGRILTEEAVCKFMKDAAAEVGVRPEVRVSPHTCRHTFAHMQLRNGCDIYTLSRMMGHESISITQRYLEGIQDDEIVKKGIKHSPLMNLE